MAGDGAQQVRRLGTSNRHNGRIPRNSRLEDGEKAKILAFHDTQRLY
jgi:hypothetical protein